jgi:hypothetical protein
MPLKKKNIFFPETLFVERILLFRILKEAEKRDRAEQLRKERERGIEEKRKKQVKSNEGKKKFSNSFNIDTVPHLMNSASIRKIWALAYIQIKCLFSFSRRFLKNFTS